MARAEPADVAKSSRTSSEPPAFERAKRQLILACVAIAGGLAVAGSFDRTTGGVLLLVGWALAIASLHRLGRAGSDRSSTKRVEK